MNNNDIDLRFFGERIYQVAEDEGTKYIGSGVSGSNRRMSLQKYANGMLIVNVSVQKVAHPRRRKLRSIRRP